MPKYWRDLDKDECALPGDRDFVRCGQHYWQRPIDEEIARNREFVRRAINIPLAHDWIKFSDRRPTGADGDFCGSIWCFDGVDVYYVGYNFFAAVPPYTHWKPTGFTRPEPPPKPDPVEEAIDAEIGGRILPLLGRCDITTKDYDAIRDYTRIIAREAIKRLREAQ